MLAASDEHFKLYSDSLKKGYVDAEDLKKLKKLELVIINFLIKHDTKIKPAGDLMLNETTVEFDIITQVLKNYLVKQHIYIKTIVDMLNRSVDTGIEALKFVPIIGDGVIFLELMEDGTKTFRDAKALRDSLPRNISLRGTKVEPLKKKGGAPTTKKRRTTTKKRRTKRRMKSTRRKRK